MANGHGRHLDSGARPAEDSSSSSSESAAHLQAYSRVRQCVIMAQWVSSVFLPNQLLVLLGVEGLV